MCKNKLADKILDKAISFRTHDIAEIIDTDRFVSCDEEKVIKVKHYICEILKLDPGLQAEHIIEEDCCITNSELFDILVVLVQSGDLYRVLTVQGDIGGGLLEIYIDKKNFDKRAIFYLTLPLKAFIYGLIFFIFMGFLYSINEKAPLVFMGVIFISFLLFVAIIIIGIFYGDDTKRIEKYEDIRKQCIEKGNTAVEEFKKMRG